jgi:ABC-type dipeptide/oligopeptide/nickel transport system permease subunit
VADAPSGISWIGTAAKLPARFTRRALSRVGLVSGLVLGAMVALSVLALPMSLAWYNRQSLDEAVRHPPSRAPVIAVSDQPTPPKGYAASSWFGHDDLGRSLLFRVLPGFLVSFGIGLAAAMMAVGFGTCWGALAGLWGGSGDALMMRIVDVLYGLPYILMVVLLQISLTEPLTVLFGGPSTGANLVILLIAIGGVSWLSVARVVRGQVLSLRSQTFVEAAKASGAGVGRILRVHLLPNLVGPIAVCGSLVVPQAILQESFLSFLGIGVQQPTPSLGRLAADGVEALNTFVAYWWLIGFPCAFLVVTLLCLNFLADALRERLDPKSAAARLL